MDSAPSPIIGACEGTGLCLTADAFDSERFAMRPEAVSRRIPDDVSLSLTGPSMRRLRLLVVLRALDLSFVGVRDGGPSGIATMEISGSWRWNGLSYVATTEGWTPGPTRIPSVDADHRGRGLTRA